MTSNHTYLQTSLTYLKGVGPQKSKLLEEELQLRNFGDLLLYFPYKYMDVNALNQISAIHPHVDWVYLKGRVVNMREEGDGFKKRLIVTVSDGTGELELVWFQGGQWVKNKIQPNAVYGIFGKVTFFNNKPSMNHPEIEIWDGKKEAAMPEMIPLYNTTEKLRRRGLDNKAIGNLTKQVLDNLPNELIEEWFPPSVLKDYELPSRIWATHKIHFPANGQEIFFAQRRFKFEELLLAQLKINKVRVSTQSRMGYRFEHVRDYFNRFFHEILPFELTNAQKRVVREIRQDVNTGTQMNRLVQGDVGSGKTMVALMAMLLAVDNSFQASLMAPTEILARQHYEAISELLEPLGLNVVILTGTVKGKERKKVLADIESGAAHIVIGTHALIEDTVRFHQLGLSVIDEQHRFGVSQRAKFWVKSAIPPHVLVMTATPIPRTLAMTFYGDLEVSVIDELPPGRKPIQTVHRTEQYRPQIMQFIKNEIAAGRQVYIVYPLIEESEHLQFESLLLGLEQVKTWFPEERYNVAMVHGRQKPEEKRKNMERFVKGEAHILVATTVIEVGVNVPNASVMIIESAERFGLAQLHQLRGRVGRGSDKSYCFLLTANGISKESAQRMSIMVQSNDGFKIAEEDLKLRGPGDVYGTKQSGALDFQLVDIVEDVELVELTRNLARNILEHDPKLEQEENRGIFNMLKTEENKSQKGGIRWHHIG